MDYKKAIALLGLSTDSSLEDIERAYKKLASENHPDKGGSDSEMASWSDPHCLDTKCL